MKYFRINSFKSKSDRPKIKIPWTRVDWGLEILAAVAVIVGLYEILVTYPSLPDSIPVHFNFKGEADSWGGKGGLWILGIGMVVIYATMSLVSRAPHLFNYPWAITEENAERQYRIARTFMVLLKTEIMWLFAAIIGETIKVGLGLATQMEAGILYLYLSLITASVIGYFAISYKSK